MDSLDPSSQNPGQTVHPSPHNHVDDGHIERALQYAKATKDTQSSPKGRGAGDIYLDYLFSSARPLASILL